MANIKSQVRSIRADKKRNELNRWKRARIRTANKNIVRLVLEGKFDQAKAEYKQFASLLDKAVKTDLIKKGSADRKKSRMAIHIHRAQIKAQGQAAS